MGLKEWTLHSREAVVSYGLRPGQSGGCGTFFLKEPAVHGLTSHPEGPGVRPLSLEPGWELVVCMWAVCWHVPRERRP